MLCAGAPARPAFTHTERYRRYHDWSTSGREKPLHFAIPSACSVPTAVRAPFHSISDGSRSSAPRAPALPTARDTRLGRASPRARLEAAGRMSRRRRGGLERSRLPDPDTHAAWPCSAPRPARRAALAPRRSRRSNAAAASTIEDVVRWGSAGGGRCSASTRSDACPGHARTCRLRLSRDPRYFVFSIGLLPVASVGAARRSALVGVRDRPPRGCRARPEALAASEGRRRPSRAD